MENRGGICIEYPWDIPFKNEKPGCTVTVEDQILLGFPARLRSQGLQGDLHSFKFLVSRNFWVVYKLISISLNSLTSCK